MLRALTVLLPLLLLATPLSAQVQEASPDNQHIQLFADGKLVNLWTSSPDSIVSVENRLLIVAVEDMGLIFSVQDEQVRPLPVIRRNTAQILSTRALYNVQDRDFTDFLAVYELNGVTLAVHFHRNLKFDAVGVGDAIAAIHYYTIDSIVFNGTQIDLLPTGVVRSAVTNAAITVEGYVNSLDDPAYADWAPPMKDVPHVVFNRSSETIAIEGTDIVLREYNVNKQVALEIRSGKLAVQIFHSDEDFPIKIFSASPFYQAEPLLSEDIDDLNSARFSSVSDKPFRAVRGIGNEDTYILLDFEGTHYQIQYHSYVDYDGEWGPFMTAIEITPAVANGKFKTLRLNFIQGSEDHLVNLASVRKN